MTEIRVPTLGESVTEATIGRWFKNAGDAVAVDEPLVELETDKVTIEVPAPSAGTLGEIVAQKGETVAVGALLGQIAEGGAAARPASAAASAAVKEAPKPAAAAPVQAPPTPEGAGLRCATGAFGAQDCRRERHRCLDRPRLGQGWPRHQGRHARRH
jgi:2-oxoglutarate dehydrogenase E2 component (dihydrolipoamide succinyltransferase)